MVFKVHSPAGAATRKPNSARQLAKSKHATSKKNHVVDVFYVFWFPAPRDRKNIKNTTPEPPQSPLGTPPGA